MSGFIHRRQQLIGHVGLFHIVISATAQGFAGGAEAGLAADHDDGGVNVVACDVVHHLMPVHVLHVQVEQHQIKVFLLQQATGFLAAECGFDAIVLRTQKLLQTLQHSDFVVDGENAGLLRIHLKWLGGNVVNHAQLTSIH
jgi:hypothetical protein